MFAREVLAALQAETEALSAVLHTLDPPQFDQPTNCPPWDLRELVVHLAYRWTSGRNMVGLPIAASS